MKIKSLLWLSLLLMAAVRSLVNAQPQRSVTPAPDRRTTGNDAEGEGPFDRLVIRSATIKDGTGASKLNDQTNQVERGGGVKFTIKDGVIYDAKKLLSDVEEMVEAAKKQAQTASK